MAYTAFVSYDLDIANIERGASRKRRQVLVETLHGGYEHRDRVFSIASFLIHLTCCVEAKIFGPKVKMEQNQLKSPSSCTAPAI